LGSRSETLWKAIRQLLPKFFFNPLKSLTYAPSPGSAKAHGSPRPFPSGRQMEEVLR
jgi:hypothetical protein